MPPASKRKKAEGQWALGYREPLNTNERDQEGRRRAQRPRPDHRHLLQARLRLDRPRRPARPVPLVGAVHPAPARASTAARPAILEPEELDDRYFMLRVRIDGGQLDLEQLRVIADISTEYARDTADVTDRQNIQLHWIRIEDVPAIWEAARGGRPVHHRGLRRHPARHPRLPAGRHRRRRDHRRHARDRRDPRRATSATRSSPTCRASSRPRSAAAPRSARRPRDQRRLVRRRAATPSGEPGFDLWVGGGLSTNPMLAQRLGVFVPPDEVPEVWAGVVGIFRDYGYRRLRTGPG